jgi:hypothetical protein
MTRASEYEMPKLWHAHDFASGLTLMTRAFPGGRFSDSCELAHDPHAAFLINDRALQSGPRGCCQTISAKVAPSPRQSLGRHLQQALPAAEFNEPNVHRQALGKES